jgi:ATP-dependent RNA helicase RhlE
VETTPLTRRTTTSGDPSHFAALGLSPGLCAAVGAAGYEVPTPIQTHAIPPGLAGRDVLGCAQTGTGKTAAFALPIIQHLIEHPHAGRSVVRALVLAPTRELAAQIGDSFRRYARGTALRTLVVFGGVGKGPQISALRAGIDVLVATPGRLLDLMGDRAVSLAHVRHLVLDEVDRMLDMGFIRDVRRITAAVPRARQTLLFSATMPPDIAALATSTLRDPVRVAVDPVSSTCAPIRQGVYQVPTAHKVGLLLALLEPDEIERALVFTRTKHGANRLARHLERAQVAVAAIHGNKSQSARERALDGFRRGTTRVVVATDVAARGLDIKGVSHVINFDMPHDPESYVHRIGRTGRAGASGIALSFCSREESSHLAAIERTTRARLDRLAMPEGLTAVAPPPPVQARRPAATPAGPHRSRHPQARHRRTGGGGRPRPGQLAARRDGDGAAR